LSERPISETFMRPGLGQDTIERGKIAIVVSMVLVLLFMLYYYRFAGVVACVALLMNLVLVVAVMITIRAAFTLPGLAGLVLTVGMAVDANVLIFERMREELDRQATLRMAIRNGFARATTTIVDANLTTLIVAIVLYVIGTDQIRGFATILWLWVVWSMFTAIYCSRVVFDVAERQRWISKLNMKRPIQENRILIELGLLPRFLPSAGASHSRDAHERRVRVYTPHKFLDLFRGLACGLNDGGMVDDCCHGFTSDV
jgi:SecD/SecF fusion protein